MNQLAFYSVCLKGDNVVEAVASNFYNILIAGNDGIILTKGED